MKENKNKKKLVCCLCKKADCTRLTDPATWDEEVELYYRYCENKGIRTYDCEEDE